MRARHGFGPSSLPVACLSDPGRGAIRAPGGGEERAIVPTCLGIPEKEKSLAPGSSSFRDALGLWKLCLVLSRQLPRLPSSCGASEVLAALVGQHAITGAAPPAMRVSGHSRNDNCCQLVPREYSRPASRPHATPQPRGCITRYVFMCVPELRQVVRTPVPPLPKEPEIPRTTRQSVRVSAEIRAACLMPAERSAQSQYKGAVLLRCYAASIPSQHSFCAVPWTSRSRLSLSELSALGGGTLSD